MSQLRESLGEVFPADGKWAYCWNPEHNRNSVPLMSSDILVCLIPDVLPPPQSWSSHFNTLVCETEMDFLSSTPQSWETWVLIHCSPFFPWERLWASSISKLHNLMGRDDAVRVPLPTPMSPNLYFCFPSPLRAEISPLETLTSITVSHLWLSCKVSVLQVFPDWNSEALKPVHRYLPVPQPEPRSVCLLTSAQVGDIQHRHMGLKLPNKSWHVPQILRKRIIHSLYKNKQVKSKISSYLSSLTNRTWENTILLKLMSSKLLCCSHIT